MNDNKKTSKRELRRQAAAVADFIKNAPPIIRDGLESFLVDADNDFQITTLRNGKDGTEIDLKGLVEFLELAEARGISHHSGGFYTGDLEAAGKPADARQPFIQYAPEIEARREDYKTLVECFLTMIPLSTERVPPSTLDIVPPGILSPEHKPDILIHAIRDHIDALLQTYSYGLMLEPDFLRTLYIEMRLFHDHKMLEMGAGGFRHRRERERAAAEESKGGAK